MHMYTYMHVHIYDFVVILLRILFVKHHNSKKEKPQ